MSQAENYILGKTSERIEFDSRLDNQAWALALAAKATRSIRIYSQDLENLVYDTQDFIQALTSLATRNRRSHIQILVNDPNNAIKMGHRLIELSRSFTSSMQIHKPSREYQDDISAYLLADDGGYLYKPIASQYIGQVDFNDRLRVRDLNRQFEEMWQHSTPDPELRRLYI